MDNIIIIIKNRIKRIYSYRYLNQEKPSIFLKNIADFEKFLKKYAISNKNSNSNSGVDFVILDYELGDGGDDTPLKVVFSSITLMKNRIKQKEMNEGIIVLGVNSTFKLNNLKYPLIVLGIQDLQHHVFPVCFAVSCEEEKERGYVTTFRAFKNVMMSLLKNEYKPNYVIPYGKNSIFTGIQKVFGD